MPSRKCSWNSERPTSLPTSNSRIISVLATEAVEGFQALSPTDTFPTREGHRDANPCSAFRRASSAPTLRTALTRERKRHGLSASEHRSCPSFTCTTRAKSTQSKSIQFNPRSTHKKACWAPHAYTLNPHVDPKLSRATKAYQSSFPQPRPASHARSSPIHRFNKHTNTRKTL
jgi:hypothetical protein